MTDLGEAKGHCKLHHGEDVFLWNCHNFDQISSFLHHISYDFLDINRILKDDRMSVFDQFWSFTECLNTYHVSRLKYVSQVILGQCFILRIRIFSSYVEQLKYKIALWISNMYNRLIFIIIESVCIVLTFGREPNRSVRGRTTVSSMNSALIVLKLWFILWSISLVFIKSIRDAVTNISFKKKSKIDGGWRLKSQNPRPYFWQHIWHEKAYFSLNF